MSSIACFYRVPRSRLQPDGGIGELLNDATDLGDDYAWSGSVMLNLLTAMEEIGVNLGAGLAEVVDPGGDEGIVCFASSADIGIIDGLAVNQLDHESLGDGLDLDDDELHEAIGESVTVLRQLIAGTEAHEVLVIRIG